jgi:serine/threonine-protein kinase RsbW
MLRERIRHVAESLPFTDQELDDISLALVEGATNAFRHGRPDHGDGHVLFEAYGTDDCFRVFITDRGPGFDPDSIPEPDPNALPEGGMGIFLMRSVMDAVIYRFEMGTTLELVKYPSTSPDDRADA